MSASAASAQGLQNLALGLRRRHYIPPVLGRRNRFEVADKPVWLQVALVSLCFLVFGTHEETYLALYAAGVFILLSMTGWAVTRRLVRRLKVNLRVSRVFLLAGTVLAALLTTGATGIIFVERFLEGAWLYFILIPILYTFFSYSRRLLGKPSPEMDYLGHLDTYQLAGFGFGQVPAGGAATAGDFLTPQPVEFSWLRAPIEQSNWRSRRVSIRKVVVLLDGSNFAAQALPLAKTICKGTGASLVLHSAVKDHTPELQDRYEDTYQARELYLHGVAEELRRDGYQVQYVVQPGQLAPATAGLVEERDIDLLVTTTRGKSGAQNWLTGGASHKLVQELDIPILLVHSSDLGSEHRLPVIKRILIALDGSINSEKSLPIGRALAEAFDSELILLIVPAVPEVENYRAAPDVVETIRAKTEANMSKFLNAVSESLRADGITVRPVVTGSIPTSAIVSYSAEQGVDLILITSRGRGGLDYLMMGSVAQRVVQNTQLPVLITPVSNGQNGATD
ncbi:MAG: universal stress protein [Anaerolineales bacterium]|nr:universal stress protein [Anaerolineales bacterium]